MKNSTPYKIVSKPELISPARAAEILKRNARNRNVRESYVARLARDIKLDRWRLTPQGIILSAAGELVDGQHRLLAIVNADTPVWMMVAHVDATPAEIKELMQITDVGAKRSVADSLTIHYGVKNAALTAATARILATVCANVGRQIFNTADTVAVLGLYGKEIEQAISGTIAAREIVPSPIIATFAFALPVNRESVQDALHKLTTGEDMRSGNPVLTLRNWLTKGAHRTLHTGLRNEMLVGAAGNAIFNAIHGNKITMQKTGTNGIEWLRSKQRTNIVRIREALGLK